MKLLSVKEASRELKIGTGTLYKIIKEGHLKAVRTVNPVMILKEDLEEFVTTRNKHLDYEEAADMLGICSGSIRKRIRTGALKHSGGYKRNGKKTVLKEDILAFKKDMENNLNANQASKLVGVSSEVLIYRIKSGKIEAEKTKNGGYLVRRDEAERYKLELEGVKPEEDIKPELQEEGI